MFGSLFRRSRPRARGSNELAAYHLDMGTIAPKWEQLRSLNVSKNVPIGTTIQRADIWELAFETVRFQIFMNPSSHHFDPAPFSPHRVLAAYGGRIDDDELGPLEPRMWYRQIDQILEMMPRLATRS